MEKVYNVIYIASDGVVGHEENKKSFETEEDIKEYVRLWSTKKKILMLIPIMPSQAVLESDDVIEHEEYEKLFGTEEDIKEYINVMVYQEESIDVDSYHAGVRLERKERASSRMELQDQQEAEEVRLEGKARASFRVELQGQKDAEARVVSGAVSLAWTAWPSSQNYMSGWSGQRS